MFVFSLRHKPPEYSTNTALTLSVKTSHESLQSDLTKLKDSLSSEVIGSKRGKEKIKLSKSLDEGERVKFKRDLFYLLNSS